MIQFEKEYIKCNICGNTFDAMDLEEVNLSGEHYIDGWVTPCCQSFDYEELGTLAEADK